MNNFLIEQFTDVELAQYAYAIISDGEAAVVDPPRDISAILTFLHAKNVKLKAIIETHPHADFVSGHLELHEATGAPIYISKIVGAQYEHRGFDDGDALSIGAITLHALNTPGHSPDSISILLRTYDGKDHALFSGDTLFAGDVGRPDLRENAGNIQAKREELAGMMFETVQNILQKLSDDVFVYPAHGAGTLCGKALRDASSTTIGEERASNPSFQEMSKEKFVQMLTEGQPYIPKYFGYAVSMNRTGAPALQKSLQAISRVMEIPKDALVIDVRENAAYDQGHIKGALHIPADGLRFETWLGTVVGPEEQFYVVVAREEDIMTVLYRIAKIGYEKNIKGMFIGGGDVKSATFAVETFLKDTHAYTVIDVRQAAEVASKPIFAHAINLPLHLLRESIDRVPKDKPIVVHCAGGYRSMIAESILSAKRNNPVFDIGERILTIAQDATALTHEPLHL